jgi:glycosyltransferase involved in cell wall biosynthesis
MDTEQEAAVIRQAAGPGEKAGYLRLLGVRPDLTTAYAAANIVVHCPTYADPYPTVTLLAMAMRKAVVASNIGGIPEQIGDRSSGLLFPAGNSDALAELLVRLVRTPEEGERLGAEAGCRVHEICDPARQAERIIAQYETALEAASRPVAAPKAA